jgi:hypothetical protein
LTKTIGIPNSISGKNSKTHKNALKNPLLEKIILTITPKNCPHIHITALNTVVNVMSSNIIDKPVKENSIMKI